MGLSGGERRCVIKKQSEGMEIVGRWNGLRGQGSAGYRVKEDVRVSRCNKD